jgi:hypothetical protein
MMQPAMFLLRWVDAAQITEWAGSCIMQEIKANSLGAAEEQSLTKKNTLNRLVRSRIRFVYLARWNNLLNSLS